MNPAQAWTRAELNDLRKEYREHSQKSLDKCFSYLNFYVGLLAALLAATLTGLLQVPPGDARAWLLLTGPAAALALGLLGYKTFVVFYRRFVEAWVTEINLQLMLGEHLRSYRQLGLALAHYSLGLEELVEREVATLAPIAAHLVAAERRRGVVGAVD